MRDVAIVSFSQAPNVERVNTTSVELLLPVIEAAVRGAGLERKDIEFWCHGSCDYLTGQPFSFVSAVDAIGAWPPIIESHVEMDGAWALYEAWVKIQTGEVDIAGVFANGKSSPGNTRRILALELDPYYVAPLWPDQISVAALQARALLESGTITELEMAEVVRHNRHHALRNPDALVRGDHTIDELLAAPLFAHPLRAHDIPPITDGACAIVLAAGDAARKLAKRPVWIRGIDHRIDVHDLGNRDLTQVPSAVLAAQKAGAGNDKVDVAELHAPFSHEDVLLRKSLGLDAATTWINPSGGALCANPLMAAGLTRIGEVAKAISSGKADRGVAHATQGPCLQQNLVCVLEGE